MGSSDELLMLNPFGGHYPYIFLIGFALYFCKDSIKGRSFGKRVTRLQVLDNTTGQVASPLQCLVRNLFCIIWPIEVIVTLTNPTRRIGDRVAGTRVALYDPFTAPQPKLAAGKILFSLVISYAVMVLTFLPLPLH
ncbi:RDD family protein [Paraflavitalea speifideaquila]|uniref:RDD family protein n=1 Tax=Paraflavitalea speifideaquila TaxID=3076558 RepID=UPI0028E5D6D3|nr:RDD family protein [Paraflavitalea speifideiaquila]